ncbi:MAG: competence/damage-inducible protein A [Eubacteriales bacterium]|nr:competence/damage-inducible protein A [Eubacteriales bacterium]MDD3610996.1 competence/damage-inducible protein A [Eubacteriales bacterium]
MNKDFTSEKIDSAEIITIGTELLLGQTLDSNSYYLSGKLSDLGINTYRRQVVGDHRQRIHDAISSALEYNDLVVTTGGLGASDDDITMQVVSEIAERELVKDSSVIAAIRKLYPTADRPDFVIPLVPVGAKVFPNRNGTAPASFTSFPYKGQTRHILVLPGPPAENVPLFEEQVMPYLAQFCPAVFRHRYVRMIGISEYKMEQALKDLIETQTNPTIAPYTSEGEVLLRITQRLAEGDEDKTQDIIDIVVDRLAEYIYEIGPRSLEQVVADQLRSRNLTCAFAESCTGGALAARLVTLSETSNVFKGSIVAYTSTVKKEVLGVDPEIIETYGVVSAECAQAMVENCRSLLKADLNVSITGFAGPDGGNSDNPVGTVYFGVAVGDKVSVHKKYFPGNRKRVINYAVNTALDLLRRSCAE